MPSGPRPDGWAPVFPRDKRKAFARRSCSSSKPAREARSSPRHPASGPLGALSAFALQRPPMPDHGLAGGGMAGGPVLRGHSQFEPLHRACDGNRLILTAEADQFDPTVVRHHFLEAEMSKRSEILQFRHRQLDMDPVRPGCHLLQACLVSLAPTGDADGIAEGPQQRLLDHQKRFVRDTAHQLRTPLAVLKAQVQSARRGDVGADQALAEIDQTVEELLDDADWAEVVDQLDSALRVNGQGR